MSKIGMGGGCHWCTEAVFQSLKGVVKVEQGYIGSMGECQAFSEAVIIHFNSEQITLKTLIEVHLLTHKSTSNHSMRKKYRSAIYFFTKEQAIEVKRIINELQGDFNNKLVTKVLKFNAFKSSRAQLLNYYYSNPNKPFCKNFITPKLTLILNEFSEYFNSVPNTLESRSN